MPLYDYRCAACGKITEIRHGFNETNREPCPHCGGALTRVFNPAPIVFKGSGFYKTDSRASSSPPAADATPAAAPAAAPETPATTPSDSDSAA